MRLSGLNVGIKSWSDEAAVTPVRVGAGGLLRLVVAVAAIAAVVGCAEASEPSAELLEGPLEASDAVLADGDDAAAGAAATGDVDDGVGDGDVDGDVDVSSDGGGDDLGVADGVETSDDGGVDAGGEGGVDAGSDDGGVDTGGEGGVDAVGGAVVSDGVVVVDDGGGGLLVVGLCGWPGPLCLADEGVAPLDEGGRLWWRQRSQWEPWVGRVLDMCDDHEALVAIDGQYWAGRGDGIDYGAEIHPWYLSRVLERRERRVIVCSEAEAATPRWSCWGPGLSELRAYLEGLDKQPEPSEVVAWAENRGLDCYDAAAERRRYVYVADDGPMWPEATVQAAAEAYRDRAEPWHSGPTNFLPGNPMGYRGDRFVVESPRDALVVLRWSVSVIDGVVRGLAQNHSRSLWARNVAVTATDPAGVEGVWRFPLAVQPGEPVPFEIEGWTGSQSPSEISLEVSADLSPRIDLTRSLKLIGYRGLVTKEEFLAEFPEEMATGEMAAGEIPDFFDFFQVDIQRRASTAHPRLAEAALEQPIENLTVYGATFDGGAVSDVFELTPMTMVYPQGSEPQWVEVPGFGVELSDIGLVGYAEVGVILKNYSEPLIWAGGTDA